MKTGKSLAVPDDALWFSFLISSLHPTIDTNSISHYYKRTIRRYRDSDTEAIAERRRVNRFLPDVQHRTQMKLIILKMPVPSMAGECRSGIGWMPWWEIDAGNKHQT